MTQIYRKKIIGRIEKKEVYLISSKNVGLIGLGNLGLQIAHNLISFDFTVAGYRRGEMDHFVAAGGIPNNSPYDVARHSDIVFTCLPSGPV